MANCIPTHGTGCRVHRVHTCIHSHTLAHTHECTHTHVHACVQTHTHLSLKSSGEIKSKADVRVKPGLRQRGGSAKHEKAGACQTRTHLPMDCSQYKPAAGADLQPVLVHCGAKARAEREQHSEHSQVILKVTTHSDLQNRLEGQMLNQLTGTERSRRQLGPHSLGKRKAMLQGHLIQQPPQAPCKLVSCFCNKTLTKNKLREEKIYISSYNS